MKYSLKQQSPTILEINVEHMTNKFPLVPLNLYLLHLRCSNTQLIIIYLFVDLVDTQYHKNHRDAVLQIFYNSPFPFPLSGKCNLYYLDLIIIPTQVIQQNGPILAQRCTTIAPYCGITIRKTSLFIL